MPNDALKQRLIEDLHSQHNPTAQEAAINLRRQGWLTDGSLQGVSLYGANLRHASLRGADLRGAIMSGVQLIGADLRSANLANTDMIDARLDNANLAGADLTDADLIASNLAGANLRNANLSGAAMSATDLRFALFQDTVLDEADLNNAKCDRTIFASVDLSSVRNLHSVLHLGRSDIGLDTFFRSHGQLPAAFLRGCGVPEILFAHLHEMTEVPAAYAPCFIRYSHPDRFLALKLYQVLQGHGVRGWLDEHKLRLVDELYGRHGRGIRPHDRVMLLLSEDSLQSGWLDKAVEEALAREEARAEKGVEGPPLLHTLNTDGYLYSGECDSPYLTDMQRRVVADFSEWRQQPAIIEQHIGAILDALRRDG
jgi:hypothetical protein